jgi:hypothetical protein
VLFQDGIPIRGPTCLMSFEIIGDDLFERVFSIAGVLGAQVG